MKYNNTYYITEEQIEEAFNTTQVIIIDCSYITDGYTRFSLELEDKESCRSHLKDIMVRIINLKAISLYVGFYLDSLLIKDSFLKNVDTDCKCNFVIKNSEVYLYFQSEKPLKERTVHSIPAINDETINIIRNRSLLSLNSKTFNPQQKEMLINLASQLI